MINDRENHALIVAALGDVEPYQPLEFRERLADAAITALATNEQEPLDWSYHEPEPKSRMWELSSDEINSDHTTPQPNKEVAELVEAAFMAGQIDCGIDPSYSSAQSYAIEALAKHNRSE